MNNLLNNKIKIYKLLNKLNEDELDDVIKHINIILITNKFKNKLVNMLTKYLLQ